MTRPPLEIGDTGVTVQLGPCLGGLVRTWSDPGGSRLWSTPDADWLRGVQGTGVIGRTLREERRYREAAVLFEAGGTLLVQSRVPAKAEDDGVELDARVVRLEPADQPADAGADPTVAQDFRALLAQAIAHCVASDEFLVVEAGGWDAPTEPYCLFLIIPDENGPLVHIETAPAPHGSDLWAPHIEPDRPSTGLTAPARPDTIDVAPLLMLGAIGTWGRSPLDLALTFGRA